MSGRRHLSEAEVVAALRRGAQVEQFLGFAVAEDGARLVRWLTMHHSGRSNSLFLHEVEDVGSDEFLDVYEFPPADPDECVGEGRPIAEDEDPAALFTAASSFGAADDRWVNAGVVQDEYADARRAPSGSQTSAES